MTDYRHITRSAATSICRRINCVPAAKASAAVGYMPNSQTFTPPRVGNHDFSATISARRCSHRQHRRICCVLVSALEPAR